MRLGNDCIKPDDETGYVCLYPEKEWDHDCYKAESRTNSIHLLIF